MRGNLRQRTKGSWTITVDIGKDPVTGERQQRYETVHGNKGVAQDRMSELLTEIAKHGYVKTPKGLTVASYLEGWLNDYVAVNCSPKTIESYSGLIKKHIIPEIGKLPLIDLEPRHLQTLYGKKKQSGLSGRTVHYIYGLLAEALGHAVKQGLLYRNAARAMDPPRAEHTTIPTLAPEQLDIFFKAARETGNYPLFYTLLHTGLRRGEALALQWKDVDLGATGYIKVTRSLNRMGGETLIKEPKTAAGKRKVALSSNSVLVLRQHREAQEALRASLDAKDSKDDKAAEETKLPDDDYIFCHTDGSPLDPSTISHIFAKTLRKAGLPPMPLHSLRHAHATYLLSAGVHPKIVQERLGHSSIQITLNTYSHVAPGLQEAAAQKMDEFLSANAKPEKNVDKMLTNQVVKE